MAATIAMTDEPVALNEAPFLSLFLLSFWLGLFGLVSPGLFWSPRLVRRHRDLGEFDGDALADGIAVQHGLHRYLPTFVDTTFSEATPAASVLTVVFPPMAETPSGSSNATSALASGLPNESLTVACTVRMALPSATAEHVDRGQRGLLGIRLGGVGDRALGQFVGGRNLHRIGLVAAVILDLHPQFMTGGGWTWCMRQVWYDHG